MASPGPTKTKLGNANIRNKNTKTQIKSWTSVSKLFDIVLLLFVGVMDHVLVEGVRGGGMKKKSEKGKWRAKGNMQREM